MNILQSLANQAKQKKDQLVADIQAAPQAIAHTVAPAAANIAGRAAYDITHNPVTNTVGRNVAQPALHFMENGGIIGMNHPVYQQFSRGVSHGLERSAIGTGQALSGLYDIAGGQHGTNRVDKFLNTQAQGIDNIVKQQHINPLLYKAAQASGDALQMAIGGGQAKLAAKGLTELPKVGGAFKAVGKGLALTEKPGQAIASAAKDGNIGQRVVSRAAGNILSPKYQAINAAFTAGQEGKNASHGMPVTGRSAAMDLAIGGVGFPVAGAIGSEIAAPLIRSAAPGIKQSASVINREVRAASDKKATNDAMQGEVTRLTRQKADLQKRLNNLPVTNYAGAENVTRHIDQLDGRIQQTKANMPKLSIKDRLLAPNIGLTVGGPNALQYQYAKKAGKVFKGVDGKPRFEMNDSNAKLTSMSGNTLGDVLDHPELYQNYPQLKNMPVVFDKTMDASKKGSFDGKTLRLNPNGFDKEELRRTILHEVQHGIQNTEKFASGGTPGSFLLNDAEKLSNKIHQTAMKSIDLSVKRNPIAQMRVKQLQAKHAQLTDSLNRVMDRINSGDPALNDQYHRLAGEAEARAVEARAYMPQNYRDAKPFYDSLDVPKKDLIIQKNNGPAMSIDPTPAPTTTPTPPPQRAAIPAPELPASRPGLAKSEVPLPKSTAESNFPLRVMTDPRTDPIMPTLNKLATHDVKHNADVLADTGAKIAQNEDAALAFAKRGSSTEANATAMQLLEKYLSEGNHEKASDLLQSVAPRFTRQGQETQILAAYSKLTPTGAVRYAAKEVEKAAGKSANGLKLEDKTAQVHTAVQQTAKDVASQLSEEVKASKVSKTPEEMLAQRIKAPSDKQSTSQDPVKDMVATLHKVAKQVIPDAEKKLPRDPMELVGQAIKGKAEYAGVYDKAKALVLDKYKDNPQALAELEKYFGTDATRTYAESQLKTGMQQGLKGTNLSKIVKEHYTSVDETGQELKQKLIERAGLSESEATQLSADIQKRYDQLISEKKDSVIKQIFGDKPKPEQVQLADRILQYHNLGAMGRDELRPLIAKKLGLETLSPEASKTISGMAAHIQTLADGSSERMQATADMMRFIAEQKPQSRLDNAVGIYKAGMLSGPKTQEGNALSNSIFGGLKKVSDVPASLVDRGFALAGKTPLGQRVGLTGNRTIGLTTRGTISGTKTGFGKGVSVMRGKPEFAAGDKYEQHAEINLKNPILQKIFGTPSNYVFRGMQAADQPFRYAALKNSLYDQAYAAGRNEGLRGSALKTRAEQLVQNPTDQMAATATREAKKSVLDYDTYASRAIQAAHTGIDRMVENGGSPLGGKIANGALNVLGPFVRVPSAFISRTVDFTPLGIGKEVGHQLFTKSFDQRALSQAIGEGLTGTGIIALGMHLSGQGQLSGDYPKNNQKEQQRWKAEGIQPNSIKIGNSWKSLNYLGPVGLLFGAGQKIDQAKGSSNIEKTSQAVAGLGRGLLGQSFLQGLNGFSTAVQDPTKVGSYLNSEASSIIPSWVNDIGNATDKLQRQANSVGDAVKGRLPGIRHGLDPKQDVYGNALPNQSSGLNAINGLKPSNDLTTNNPVTSEVSRLHSVDPNNSDLQVTPTPITSITIPADRKGDKSTTVKLNDKQKYDVQKQVGQSIQTNWGQLIKTPEYQKLDDAGKAKALSNMRADATELASRKYVVDNNLGTYSKPASKSAIALSTGNINKYTSGTSGSGVTVSDQISPHSQKVLNEYNGLSKDQIKQKAYNEPSYDYKVAQAKYDNAVANGTLSKSQLISQQDTVDKAKVGSNYSKDVRELYGLSKSDLYSFLTSDPNGKTYADQLQAYDKALKSNGIISTAKFKNGFNPGTKGANGTGKSLTTLLSEFKLPGSENVRNRSKAASLARNAKLAKKRG